MRGLLFAASAGIFASLIAGGVLVYVSGPALALEQWLWLILVTIVAFLAALRYARRERVDGDNVIKVGHEIRADGDVVVKDVTVHHALPGEQQVGTKLHSGGNVEVSKVTMGGGVSNLDKK